MADMYSAMVGGAPTDQQSQQALAAALRQQALLGQLGQASGDRVLAPLGASLQKGAMQGGQDIANEREKQASLQQALTFHQDQQQHEADALAWQKQHGTDVLAQQAKEAELSRANMRDMLSQRGDQAEDLAALKAKLKDNAADGKSLTAGDTKPLDGLKETINHLQTALATFKPEYAGTSIPGGRPLANTFANMGLGTDNSLQANNWWQQYGRGFKLGELHNQFGARLTQTENDLFNKYHLSENMTPEQIQQTLGNLITDFQSKYKDRLDNRQAGGWSKNQITQYRQAGGLIDQDGNPTFNPPGHPAAAVPAANGAPPVKDVNYYLNKASQPQAPAPAPALPQSVGAPINTNGMRLPTIPGLQPNNLYTGFGQ